MAASAQDHSGLEVLPYDECLLLLAQTPVGRVAFSSDGELVILPVNHAMDGASIVFRTAAGTKLRAAESAAVVGFEVDGFEPGLREGWSVVVSGTAELVLEDAELHRLESYGLRPWSDAQAKPHWIRIRPTQVTGRRISHQSGT
jgi:nitroimidazol reductase NimA-like FMN-containing flavoprotein (pyridoxamine 5'-phosphate oxidase superfamily)